MALIRFLAVFFIIIALMLLGADIVSTLETPGGLVVRSLDRVLLLVQADAKSFVQRTFPVWVVAVCLSLLASPASAVFGTLGILFSLLGLPGLREEQPKSKVPPIRR